MCSSSHLFYDDEMGQMNDSLNNLYKTKGKKMQIDLMIGKVGLTSGSSLTITHISVEGDEGWGNSTLLTVFLMPVSNQHKVSQTQAKIKHSTLKLPFLEQFFI